MSRAYAIFSSLCLSPALLCSLEPNGAPSDVLVPQRAEVEKTETVVTESSPSNIEIPKSPPTEPPAIEAVIPDSSSSNIDIPNPPTEPSVFEADIPESGTAVSEDSQKSDIESDETLMMKSDPQNDESSLPNDHNQAISVETSEEYCGCTPRPERIEVRHIEAKGIGYNKGYTTVEGFFVIPSTLENDWVPFLDIRGHVFNDGRPAANAGLGLRYLSSRVWGANIYYDYRKTSRVHYNQIGAGLETLGNIWDFRINGYFPVGKRESGSYHFKFDRFKGNRMILKSKREFAMIGGNAEVGAHAYHSRKVDLYAAAGPYYFAGQGRSTWGGEGRLAFTGFNCLRLQVSGSYDRIFKGIVQGEIGLFYSWGEKKMVKKRECMDCCDSRMIVKRALQRVDRQEIIVASHKREKSAAINPVTGDPYTFWFVNNLSHSLGTFESPFNTLAAAESASGPNDVIYVYPGDGTDTGMNKGIILKQGQQFLGAGIDQVIPTTKGKITIPAQASGLPFISNTLATNTWGVHLSESNNVVSGFHIQDNLGVQVGSAAIRSSPITISNGVNYLIQNNVLSTFKEGNGINIDGGKGQVAIINNTILCRNFNNDSHGIGIRSLFSTESGPILIENNLVTGATPLDGFRLGIFSVANNIELSVVSNRFTSEKQTFAGGAGIIIDTINSTVYLAENFVDLPATFISPEAGIKIGTGPGAHPVVATLENNTSLTIPPVPGYLFQGTPATLQLNFGASNVGTRVGP